MRASISSHEGCSHILLQMLTCASSPAEPGIYKAIVMTKEPKPSDTLLLEMRQIDKSFPGVHALKNISMKLRSGEVLGLVGENGAGKSTLIKVLGGAHLPDAGSILIEGQSVHIPSPTAAQQAGVSIIYQEFNLIPELTVRELSLIHI